MMLISALAALAAATPPEATSAIQSSDPSTGAPAILAARTPLGLADVEALLGRSLHSLQAAPLICGPPGRDGARACRVAQELGAFVIDTPPSLTPGIRMRRMTLSVRADRVEAVSLETSPDNFHTLVGLLNARFGRVAQVHSTAVEISHQVRPRVTMTWCAGDRAASLTDPTPLASLAVRIASLAPPLPGRACGAMWRKSPGQGAAAARS